LSLTVADLEAEFKGAGVPADIANELFESFLELKRRFALGDLRPNVVEGGRFSEAAFRVLEWMTTSQYTAIGQTLPRVPTLMGTLAQSGHPSASVRLHIPRTLNLIYDLRNKRDAAHLADGIDPNVQDATLVVSTASWVLAEFVRLLCSSDPDAAHDVIVALVGRDIPVVQEINGFPRVLRTLKASQHILVLLYWSQQRPLPMAQLKEWVPQSARTNLRRTLATLESKHLVHVDDAGVHITIPGEQYVVSEGLLTPA
jgi:hypothetical protein